MQRFSVTGMSCAACSARVEKAVRAVEGVAACSVNLLTNSMTVEGSADAAAVIGAVQAAGYGARAEGEASADAPVGAGIKDEQTPLLKKRLWSSVVLLIPLMYLSMGHMVKSENGFYF